MRTLAHGPGPRAHRGGERVFNFAAGPAAMPREVLEQAREELLDWGGTGMSVWELPFTGEAFRAIAAGAERALRALLGVPAQYRILFMHGGASAQFSIVPLNLLRGRRRADYVETGHWSRKAIAEARRYCEVNVAASAVAEDFTRIPPQSAWQPSRDAAYCHITANETADGVEYHWTPETGGAPLVADMTSNFLTRPLDLSRYGLIYAGAQKNIGPAGLVVVIVREDLIGAALPETPSVFDYGVQAESEGRFNTPLTYAIYLAGLVFRWIGERGGLAAMAEASLRKSGKLYAAIDASGFYHCRAAPGDRSRVNVCFELAEPRLVERFLAEAAPGGLVNLRGHAAKGGLRASLYNAMPEAGVDALVAFMNDFARRHG